MNRCEKWCCVFTLPRNSAQRAALVIISMPLLHHGPSALRTAVRRIMNRCEKTPLNSFTHPYWALSIHRPLKGAPLKPHLLVGWGILAHGETVGHGALRHKRRAPWGCYFDTPSAPLWDALLFSISTHPPMPLFITQRNA